MKSRRFFVIILVLLTGFIGCKKDLVVAKSKEANITYFRLFEQNKLPVIDINSKKVQVEVVNSANMSSLCPIVKVSEGATLEPGSQVARNFSSGYLTYHIVAADGETAADWTIQITKAAKINNETSVTGFTFPEIVGTADIIEGNGIIDIIVNNNADLTKLTPNITISSGATIEPATGVEQNFSSLFRYKVTAENKKDYSYWYVRVKNKPYYNDEAKIREAYLDGQVESAIIDYAAFTVSFKVNCKVVMSQKLTPLFSISSGATISPASGSAQDFSNGNIVKYTVAAEDKIHEQVWDVSVAQEPARTGKNITGFSIAANIPSYPATIDTDNHTIGIKVEKNSVISKVIPQITVSDGATVSPESGVEQDFSEGKTVTYTVTAEDGSTQEWVASITEATRKWTVMYYGNGDSETEAQMVSDFKEMLSGINTSPEVSCISLIDRIEGYSTDAIGKMNYSGTCMYKLLANQTIQLEDETFLPTTLDANNNVIPAELNMGDPVNLKKFIAYCKSNYTAENYALIIADHLVLDNFAPRGIVYDKTSNDYLYTGEITDTLTSAESVDLLCFDGSLMGNAETAYQFSDTGKFSAKYFVASPARMKESGFNYTSIFQRINNAGGTNPDADDYIVGDKEIFYKPSVLSAATFASLFIEEFYDDSVALTTQAMSVYDLSKSAGVKTAVDNFIKQLLSEGSDSYNKLMSLHGSGLIADNVGMLRYFKGSSLDYLYAPFVDIYDMTQKVLEATKVVQVQSVGPAPTFTPLVDAQGHPIMEDVTVNFFNDTTRARATTLAEAVNSMVLYSFAQSGSFYGNASFVNHVNGLPLFFTNGDVYFNTETNAVTTTAPGSGKGGKIFYYQWWYNPFETSTLGTGWAGYYYGKLLWCSVGRTGGNSTVDNWFDFLDSKFDEGDSLTGGWNKCYP